MIQSLLNSPIEYLKGVGPVKGDILKKEAGIFTFEDLLNYFPFRHIDRTKITPIRELNLGTEYALVNGKVISVEVIGVKHARRLVAMISDGTGALELVWFQGIYYLEKMIHVGDSFQVFGKVSFFMNKPQMSHPELEKSGVDTTAKPYLEPVYPSTEKLKLKSLGGRQLSALTQTLVGLIKESDLPENLPASLLQSFQLISRYKAYCQIHFPKNVEEYEQAVRRLKFEELFLAQLRMSLIKVRRQHQSVGFVFEKVGNFFNDFYNHHLPFELTGAQKRVLKEIRKDMGGGRQMNRLLQGDVGSGKTMVALLAMLIAADNGFQSCFMAPTEILARQHFESLQILLKDMDVEVGVLTGSTPAKERKEILEKCATGKMHIITGTHALIEEKVVFKNLGLAIVDEQHRFGVAQRAKLWKKNKLSPHILVMTATPIPRTLALTAYGDLDYSIMDELPPGRTPVLTVHRTAQSRMEVMTFVRQEIEKGRQAYFIYPLIEESAKLDYEDLMKGFEEVKAYFPEPKFYISMVHGRQKADIKQTNMDRFVSGDTNIMVSTTVIEVGVNVPNASVMVIESAERFGLPQLHQLRGRVGRGSEKSYCILLTGTRVSQEARERLNIMCQTNDGFKIAEKDLEIRGPGDVEGTRQSGLLNFKIANILEDKHILQAAHESVEALLSEDPDLVLEKNQCLKKYLSTRKGKTVWSKIS